jgi:hypothetical protein
MTFHLKTPGAAIDIVSAVASSSERSLPIRRSTSSSSSIPDEPVVVVDRDLVVHGPDGRTVPLDVYRPARTGDDTSPMSGRRVVHRDGDPETLAAAKDWASTALGAGWPPRVASSASPFRHVSTRG